MYNMGKQSSFAWEVEPFWGEGKLPARPPPLDRYSCCTHTTCAGTGESRSYSWRRHDTRGCLDKISYLLGRSDLTFDGKKTV